MAGPRKHRGAADALMAQAQQPDWRMRNWHPALREEYEERAAIIEFCGNETRERAESMAFEMLSARLTTQPR